MRLGAFSITLAVVALLICGSAWGQVLKGSKSITNQAVTTMVQLGMPDDAIIAAINVGPVNFDTSSNALISLRSQGVSGRVLQAMIVAERKASVAASGGGQRGALLAPQRTVALANSQGSGPGGMLTSGGNQNPNISRMLAPQRTVALAGSSANNGGSGNGNLGPVTRLGRNGPIANLTTCTVTQLRLKFGTGGDDLRGGQDNLNIIVYFTTGGYQVARNVNQSNNWPNNSVNVVYIPLSHPVPPGEIRALRLVHVSDGSFNLSVGSLLTPAAPFLIAKAFQSPDNWNMNYVRVAAIGNGVVAQIAGHRFHRFTGSNPDLIITARVPANICSSGAPAGNSGSGSGGPGASGINPALNPGGSGFHSVSGNSSAPSKYGTQMRVPLTTPSATQNQNGTLPSQKPKVVTPIHVAPGTPVQGSGSGNGSGPQD